MELKITVHRRFREEVESQAYRLRPPDRTLREQGRNVWLREVQKATKRSQRRSQRMATKVARVIQQAAHDVGLQESVAEVLVVPSPGSGEPEVELCACTAGHAVKLYLCALEALYGRSEEGVDFANVIRHELMHPRDELDPAFGYDLGLAHTVETTYIDTPSSHELASIHFIVNELWNVNIDGRLRGKGVPADNRRQSFGNLFPPARRKHWNVFDRLWAPKLMPYPELVKLARQFEHDGVVNGEGPPK